MLTPGTLLQNRYLIVGPIGQGGMGAVYLAEDRRLGNKVALKEALFTDASMRRAFEREARILAQLRHPALPKVSDHFEEGSGQFIVMDYIPGDNLEEKLARRGQPFPVEQVLQWSDQLLDALDYLHTQETPILHRDIKPSNLKLASRDQIILLDFGLAKGSAGLTTSFATNRSVRGYTPHFAPLEQIQGTGTDFRSDFYSLGATFYYLLTGVIPPDALSRASANINNDPDPLRPAHQVNPQVPLAISEVLTQVMSQSPRHRPSNAAAVRRALRNARESSLSASGAATTVALPQTPEVSAGGEPASTTEPPVRGSLPPTQAAPFVRQEIPVRPVPLNPYIPSPQTPYAIAPPPRAKRVGLIIGSVLALLVLGLGLIFFLKVRNRESASPENISAETARREGIAATVNGKKIMLAEVDQLIREQSQGQEANMSPTELATVRLQALDSLIKQEALFQRAEREGLSPSEDEITGFLNELKAQSNMTEEDFQKRLKEMNRTLESVREDARKQKAIEKLQGKYSSNISISDRDIIDFYNKNREKYVSQRGVGLANIVVDPANNGLPDDAKGDAEAKQKIDYIYQQLKSGADFATMARAYSEDTTGAKGGDIGFATEKDLRDNGFSPKLIAQFFGPMQPGEITEPVRFNTGRWYIFKLQSKQLQTENLTLESPGVRDQIAQALHDQRRDVANATLLESIMGQTRVVNYLAASLSNMPLEELPTKK